MSGGGRLADLTRAARAAPRSWALTVGEPLARRAARAYIAGPRIADAMRIGRRLSRRGFAVTLGYWNREGEPCRTVAERCLAALTAGARGGLDCRLSVKAPALGFSPEILSVLAQRGSELGIGIHFDALAPEAAGATFAAIAAVRSSSHAVGCTLPGRWARSARDAEWAIENELSVRVVKGEWAESGVAAAEPRAGFLAVVDRLAGRARQVSVATHDPPLAREALDRLIASGTPCGLEVLWGWPAGPVIELARRREVPVRVYVPHGDAWLPYRLARITCNPCIGWWFLRDLIFGRAFRMPPAAPRTARHF
jgi:proline dehydrogenase